MKDEDKSREQLLIELLELRQQEVKRDRILNLSNDLICVMGVDGYFKYLNPAWERTLGYSREELLSKSVFDFVHYDDHHKNREDFLALVDSGKQNIDYENHLIGKDGSIRIVSWTATILPEEGLIYCIGHDITERKRAEETSREREEKMQSIFRVAPTGIGVVKDRILLDVNPRICEMTGYSKEELVGKSARIFYATQEDFEYVGTEKYRQISEKGTGVVETRWMKKDGTIIDVLLASTPIDLTDLSKGVTFTALDITERKKTEAALHESDIFLRAVIDLVPHFIFVKDDQSRFMLVNKALAEAYGTTTHDIIGKSDIDFSATPEEAEHFHKNDLEVIRSGVPKIIPEEIITDSKGKQRYLQTVKIPFSYGPEQIPCILGVAVDITERKRAEEKLRKSEEDIYESFSTQSLINILISESLKNDPLEMILQKALNMLFSIPWFPSQVHGRIFLVEDQPDMLLIKVKNDMNEPACSQILFGKCICGRAALSQEIVISHHPDEHHECCHEGLTPHVDYAVPIIYRGQTLGVIHINVQEEHDINQRIVEFLHTIANTLAGIIERKKVQQDKERLQSQLLQGQKMEAIGTLAGGVAHDFNNLLMGIMGCTSLMLMKTDKTHPSYEELKTIERQVESGAELTKQLLGFARGGKYEVRPVNVNDLIKKTSDIFGRTKKEITIHRKLQEDLHTIEADRVQIEQVLLNLYVNAWQAMPAGGELYLESGNTILDEQESRPFNANPGQYVKISVTDTGLGMDSETQKRIFEPFFSTRSVGRGTGLGLASSYGIIKNHGGIINVYSEKGHGTTFTIYLPASAKAAIEAKPVEERLLTGEETILIVDDEQVNVELMKVLLEKLGYKILTAQSGKKAIALFKEHSKDIKLVILDMIMPEMNGKETLVSLMGIDKEVRVLLSSGYSISGEASKILDMGCKGFIQKPFRVEELSRKIRTLLDCGNS